MSVKNTDSTIAWRMGEAVTLTCPLRQPIGMNSAIMTSPLRTDGPIRNKKICVRDEVDQSALDRIRREDM